VLWGREGPEMGGCVGSLVRDPNGFMVNEGMGGGGNGSAGGEKKHSIREMFKEAKDIFRSL